jgi:hypothetical protein
MNSGKGIGKLAARLRWHDASGRSWFERRIEVQRDQRLFLLDRRVEVLLGPDFWLENVVAVRFR